MRAPKRDLVSPRARRIMDRIYEKHGLTAFWTVFPASGPGSGASGPGSGPGSHAKKPNDFKAGPGGPGGPGLPNAQPWETQACAFSPPPSGGSARPTLSHGLKIHPDHPDQTKETNGLGWSGYAPSGRTTRTTPGCCAHCDGPCPPSDLTNWPRPDGSWVHLDCELRARP
jgi:hypothetical protein